MKLLFLARNWVSRRHFFVLMLLKISHSFRQLNWTKYLARKRSSYALNRSSCKFGFISHSFNIGNIQRANYIRSYANQSDPSLGASAKFKTTWYCQAHWKFNRFHRNHIDSYCNDKKLNYLTNQCNFGLQSFWTPSSFLWINNNYFLCCVHCFFMASLLFRISSYASLHFFIL